MYGSGQRAEKYVRTELKNLSVLKTGRAKAIRFSTLERLCEVLECEPGDLLAYEKGTGATAGVAAETEADSLRE